MKLLNESKYIDLLMNYNDIDKYIKDNYTLTKDIKSLNSDSHLINKEGYFIDLGTGTHYKILVDLINNDLIKSKDSTLDEVNLINTDLFADLGYIRCNSDLYDYSYIALPKTKITSEQYNTLQVWLDDLASKSDIIEGEIHISLDVYVIDGPGKFYTYIESTDYIINRIKRYYATGNLYEGC